MAITVSYNALVTIGGTNVSDHCTRAAVNDGQETRDATAHGDTTRKFRPGLGTPSAEFTFLNDATSGSVEATLRGTISITSTGTAITCRKDATVIQSASNPTYSFDGILDGDLMVMDDEIGEIASVTGRFVPYGAFSVLTSAT